MSSFSLSDVSGDWGDGRTLRIHWWVSGWEYPLDWQLMSRDVRKWKFIFFLKMKYKSKRKDVTGAKNKKINKKNWKENATGLLFADRMLSLRWYYICFCCSQKTTLIFPISWISKRRIMEIYFFWIKTDNIHKFKFRVFSCRSQQNGVR